MNIIVHSSSLPITDSLRSFIERQVEKLTKFTQRVQSVYVYLTHIAGKKSDPTAMQVKIHVHISGRPDIIVKRKATDMYEAIVDTADRVVRQVRKQKEKIRSKYRRAKKVLETTDFKTYLPVGKD